MDIHGLFLYLTTFQSKISQHIEEARELNGIGRLARREVFHHTKLLVGKRPDHHLALIGKHRLDPPHMRLCLLHTRTMAHIDGVLKHCEAILQQLLAEAGSRLALLRRTRREIRACARPAGGVVPRAYASPSKSRQRNYSRAKPLRGRG